MAAVCEPLRVRRASMFAPTNSHVSHFRSFVILSEEQWDIHKLDPLYDCFVPGGADLTVITRIAEDGIGKTACKRRAASPKPDESASSASGARPVKRKNRSKAADTTPASQPSAKAQGKRKMTAEDVETSSVPVSETPSVPVSWFMDPVTSASVSAASEWDELLSYLANSNVAGEPASSVAGPSASSSKVAPTQSSNSSAVRSGAYADPAIAPAVVPEEPTEFHATASAAPGEDSDAVRPVSGGSSSSAANRSDVIDLTMEDETTPVPSPQDADVVTASDAPKRKGQRHLLHTLFIALINCAC